MGNITVAMVKQFGAQAVHHGDEVVDLGKAGDIAVLLVFFLALRQGDSYFQEITRRPVHAGIGDVGGVEQVLVVVHQVDRDAARQTPQLALKGKLLQHGGIEVVLAGG